ncbi:MAG: hypothetical protein LQ340_005882 [Diploschistes diacapsis]|nr:MAG: hypothetical protein LQ340_005882 [Diploschistes diacapsis]
MSDDNINDLENFRKQWREEVLRKRAAPSRGNGSSSQTVTSKATNTQKPEQVENSVPTKSRYQDYDDGYSSRTYDFGDLEEREELRKLGPSGSGVHPESQCEKEPVSALEHYEEAVENEKQGKLGESLRFYRKAFRLDDAVDQKYKAKHFPPSSFPKWKPLEPTPAPLDPRRSQPSNSSNLSDLVASFAAISIPPAPPIIARDPPPLCPIASLPGELLSEILDQVASTDVAILPRLALVCKRLAYLVASYDGMWKRVVHSSKYGISGMYFEFAQTVDWVPILPKPAESTEPSPTLLDSLAKLDLSSSTTLSHSSSSPQFPNQIPFRLPPTLTLTPTYPTYRSMHRSRPRLRFTGLYISTVNYTRPGAASPNQITWNSPVHIVTYYRYLRFYRDGTCISLLTTVEPADVVPHLHRENVGRHFDVIATQVQGGAGVMRSALRGRWKLSLPHVPGEKSKASEQDTQASSTAATATATATATGAVKPTDSTGKTTAPSEPSQPQLQPHPTPPQPREPREPEGNLTIETQGPTPAYTYHMHLQLRNNGAAGALGSGSGSDGGLNGGSGVGSGPAHNTKLAWRGYWSYNRLTDDWAEFGLRNDRAFVWSRVRSWGEG